MSRTPTERIINRFNHGIDELNASNNFAKSGNINEQQEKLHNTAEAIYEALEWSLKSQKDDLVKHIKGETKYAEYYQKLIRSNNPNEFYDLLDLFDAYYMLKSKDIDVKMLKDFKKPVRNTPVHDGSIPHYGSMVKATSEVRKLILICIDQQADLKDVPLIESSIPEDPISENPNWEKFLGVCDNFEEQRTYILIIGPCSELSEEQLILLGQLNWTLIIDLDPNTDTNGFCAKIKAKLSQSKKIHLFTCEQQQTFSPFNAVYWLAAKGLVGRNSTISNDFKNWQRANKKNLPDRIEAFAKTFPAPITAVIMDDSKDYIKEVCRNIDLTYGNGNKFVYAIGDPSTLLSVKDEYEGEIIPIPKSVIISGIRRFSKSLNVTITLPHAIILPAKDNNEITLPIDDYRFVEEDFEIVHKNIISMQGVEQERSDFLKGREINWYGLNRRYDVDRDITKKLIKQVENDIKKRVNTLIYFNYYPGSGGTTVAKRIGWHFHNEYPTLVIKRYEPKITANRINIIYSLTTKPIFVIIESSVVSPDNIRRLLNEVKAKTFPTVFLFVQRRYSDHVKDEFAGNECSEYPMSKFLSDDESSLFINSYKEILPSKQKVLDDILTSGRNEEKHPFFVGLIAFEKNFLGLENYIKRSLEDATDTQKKVAAFLSLAYYYAQQSLSPQFFLNLLGIPQNRTVKLEDHLSHSLRQILVSNKVGGKLVWRPLHQLIAKELIEQILAGNSTDKRLWKQNLSDYAIEFIELSSKMSSIPSNNQIELLKRLFILRDNESLLDTPIDNSNFSALIEDTPKEGRLPIFKKLKEFYPDEAHFWAHLARYYSKEDKNINEALYHVDQAIKLSLDEDPLLFHMKGMCLATRVHILTEKWWKNKECPKEVIEDLKSLVKDIGELFAKTRELDKYSEYGYVSHIDLLIHTIDFGYSISNFTKKSDFLKKKDNSWFRELLDLAENLFENVKRLKDGDESANNKSFLFIDKCNLKLNELYENYSAVIAGWNELLGKGVYEPPVRRQIVRAYLRRSGSWDKITDDITRSILDLMGKNILEEPQDEKNIYLWFQAARYDRYTDIDTAIAKVARWHSNTESVNSTFYLYVLYTVKAIQGFSDAKITAERFIRESSNKSRFQGNRTVPVEWYGKGNGLKRIISLSSMGPKDEKSHSWTNVDLLEHLRGRISKIEHAGKGEIELECGLKAFFTPAHGNDGKGYVSGSDENKQVKFYLAFSHDGLRAYNVHDYQSD